MAKRGHFRLILGALGAFVFCAIAPGQQTKPGAGTKTADQRPQTTILVKSDPSWERFFEKLKEIVRRDSSIFTVRGRKVRMNPTWLRDHIHEMKGYKYWEEDVTSALDEFLSRQAGEGFFYEMLISAKDPHATFSGPRFAQFDRPDGLAFARLQMEADIEYLMVEGVHTAWQATGDDEWMRARLEALEKGLEYCMTDETRWSKTHQLVKRTFSIDTWDFTFFHHPDRRSIEPGMTMSIMHGDNSGMYDASLRLATMWRHLKNEEKALAWEEKAKGFRERTNKVCWNGKFYTHQVMLEWPTYLGNVPETQILSLSNTYDMNRGIADHPQCVSIIREYMERRKKTDAFAEWFTIDPPYPRGCVHPAGKYINGGISIFVAGELAKAAFRHGFEDYAVDILRRVKQICDRDGTLDFFYTRDGKPQGGGPAGWGAAAVASAMMEGLAGIEDASKLFGKVTLSPRWVALGIDEAEATGTYAASGATFRYRFTHDPARRETILSWKGAPDGLTVHLLLPKRTRAKEVLLDQKPVAFENSLVEGSPYAEISVSGKESRGGKTSLRVIYSPSEAK